MQVNADKTPVTVEDWNKAWAMQEQVMAHPSAAYILKRKNSKVEHAAIWADQEITFKEAKIDFAPGVGKQKPIIADLKTTMDAGARSFASPSHPSTTTCSRLLHRRCGSSENRTVDSSSLP